MNNLEIFAICRSLNVENEMIEDKNMRATGEVRAPELDRQLVVNRSQFAGMTAVLDLARLIGQGEWT